MRTALAGFLIVAVGGAAIVILATGGDPAPALDPAARMPTAGAGPGGGGGRGSGGGHGGHRGDGPGRGPGAPSPVPQAPPPGTPEPPVVAREPAAPPADAHDPDFDWREQVAEPLGPESLVRALAPLVREDGSADPTRLTAAFPGPHTARPADSAGDAPQMVRQGLPKAVKHFVFARVEDPQHVRWISATTPERRPVGDAPAWVVRVTYSAPDLEPRRQDRLFFLQHDAVVWVTDARESR